MAPKPVRDFGAFAKHAQDQDSARRCFMCRHAQRVRIESEIIKWTKNPQGVSFTRLIEHYICGVEWLNIRGIGTWRSVKRHMEQHCGTPIPRS